MDQLYFRKMSFAKAPPVQQHKVKLLREKNGWWQELQSVSVCVVSRSSIQLRDFNTAALQADIPLGCVRKLVQIDKILLRIHVSDGKKFALRFESGAVAAAMFQDLRNCFYPQIQTNVTAHSTNTFEGPVRFPGAADPALHKLVVELLSCQDFQALVREVDVVLACLEKNFSGRA